jgi:hypothetical protein
MRCSAQLALDQIGPSRGLNALLVDAHRGIDMDNQLRTWLLGLISFFAVLEVFKEK